MDFNYFYFIYYLFSFSLFLELGLRLEQQDHIVTQSVTQSQVTSHIEEHRRSWKDDVIQCIQYMLTLRQTYGCSG